MMVECIFDAMLRAIESQNDMAMAICDEMSDEISILCFGFVFTSSMVPYNDLHVY